MKNIIKPGDQREYRMVVTPRDFASFDGKIVHRVLSTFSLARDAEWTTRQFVLDLRDDDEEGIGTFVNMKHVSPAFEGEEVRFIGQLDEISNNDVICSVKVLVGERLIATATTGQKVLKKEKISKLFTRP
jgi:fluoroacetyl-CoA thioesterase